MKNVVFTTLLLTLVIAFYSCGESAEEREAKEKARQDSLLRAKSLIDEKAIEDSLVKAMKDTPYKDSIDTVILDEAVDSSEAIGGK